MPETKIPYKGDAREYFDQIFSEFPDTYQIRTLYRVDDALFFVMQNNYLHMVRFDHCEKSFRKCLGFAEFKLKANGNYEEVYTFWGLPVKEFKERFPSQSKAEKFVKAVYDKLEGLNPYVEDLGEIIEKISQEI